MVSGGTALQTLYSWYVYGKQQPCIQNCVNERFYEHFWATVYHLKPHESLRPSYAYIRK